MDAMDVETLGMWITNLLTASVMVRTVFASVYLIY